jgi:hypothetical protein
MINIIIGAFIILHALVHFWFVSLALKLVEYKPDMGWTTRSWLFTPLLGDAITCKIAAAVFFLIMLVMAVGGAAFIFSAGWARGLLTGSAIASMAALVLFWDGGFDGIVQKGLVAFLINAAIIGGMILLP